MPHQVEHGRAAVHDVGLGIDGPVDQRQRDVEPSVRQRISSQHGRVAVIESAPGSLAQRAVGEQAVDPAVEDPLVLVVDRGEILVRQQALDGQEPVAAELVELLRREATYSESGHAQTLSRWGSE